MTTGIRGGITPVRMLAAALATPMCAMVGMVAATSIARKALHRSGLARR